MVRALCAALMVSLGLGLGFSPAAAQTTSQGPIKGNFERPRPGQAAAQVFSHTLPPMGYVDFCGRGEGECKFASGTAEQLALNEQNWQMLRVTSRDVNHKIRPATDMELYGVQDYWTYPVTAGDCEDYVLLKKRELIELGMNPDLLLITVVLDENREGHAVLTVVTDKGDFVMDNRRDEVLRWDQTGYIFLKRQSQPRATEWVSLQPSAPQVIVSTKAN